MKLWRNINFRSVSNWTGVCIHGLFQEHGWDLSRALNTFFAAKCEEAEAKTVSKNVDLPKKTVAEGFRHYLYIPALYLFLCFTALQEGLLSTKAPESLVFVTWNIDGLDQTNLKKRTKGVCKILEQEKADVVFLQEVFSNASVFILSFFSI